jgi:hypothetical protein
MFNFSSMLSNAFGAVIFFLAAMVPAHAVAQGFQVKPMQMAVTAPPGRTGETFLELSNTTTEPLVLDLHVVDLSQNATGSWQISNSIPASEASKFASARGWVVPETDQVVVEPAGRARVKIAINTPPGARGAYIAGLVAEQPPQPGATGLVVRVRFLIPVIVSIAGRPARQNVELDDVRMVYQKIDGPQGHTTTGTVVIANNGRTYSRVRGELRIDRRSGDGWRLVTNVDIPERGIIPGAVLELGSDLKRRLPSGTYRLRAELHVDGRRIRPLEKELSFVGDPNIDAVAYDTALILEPAMVALGVRSGAVRTTAVSIENPGDAPVQVRMGVGTPKSLRGVVLGELRGEALSAAPWTTVRPSEFTLRPHGRQNVRIISRVPGEGVTFANYYADILLEGTYPDGQSSGETRSTIHLTNREVEAQPMATMEPPMVAEGENQSEYLIQTRVTNVGNVHLEPAVRVELMTSQREVVVATELTGETAPLLPLGIRNFGGSLDLSSVPAGDYILRAVSDFPRPGEIEPQVVVRVSVESAPAASESADETEVRLLEVLTDQTLPDPAADASAPESDRELTQAPTE